MFNKDLLLLDIEATGIDVTKHEIIQLAAILLDKDTLEEKQRFNSYIKPENWDNRDPEAMAVAQITWEQLKNASDLKSVLQDFTNTFGVDVVPTTYGGNLDIIFLPAAFKKAGLPYPYDYHTFNFWALCYTYMAKQGLLTNPDKFVGFELEEVAANLGIATPPDRHDALVDCEFEAEVLRKLITKF